MEDRVLHKWFPRRPSADGWPLGVNDAEYTKAGGPMRQLGPGQARQGVAQGAGAHRQPDFGELGGGLDRGPEDVAAR